MCMFSEVKVLLSAPGAPHLCEDPLLLWWHTGASPLQLAQLNLHRLCLRCCMKTQLLCNVVTQLLMGWILKVLERHTHPVRYAHIPNLTKVALVLEGACTWLPPMLWHWYMITGLPPWLFSPTSRQVLDPEFRIWTHNAGLLKIQQQRVVCCVTSIQKLWLTDPNFSGVKSGMKASG